MPETLTGRLRTQERAEGHTCQSNSGASMRNFSDWLREPSFQRLVEEEDSFRYHATGNHDHCSEDRRDDDFDPHSPKGAPKIMGTSPAPATPHPCSSTPPRPDYSAGLQAATAIRLGIQSSSAGMKHASERRHRRAYTWGGQDASGVDAHIRGEASSSGARYDDESIGSHHLDSDGICRSRPRPFNPFKSTTTDDTYDGDPYDGDSADSNNDHTANDALEYGGVDDRQPQRRIQNRLRSEKRWMAASSISNRRHSPLMCGVHDYTAAATATPQSSLATSSRYCIGSPILSDSYETGGPDVPRQSSIG